MRKKEAGKQGGKKRRRRRRRRKGWKEEEWKEGIDRRINTCSMSSLFILPLLKE